MGLLSKALIYREQLLNTIPKGLLYKSLKYLESKKSEFPILDNDRFQTNNNKSEFNPHFELHKTDSNEILMDLQLSDEINETEEIVLFDNLKSNMDIKKNIVDQDNVDILETVSIQDDININEDNDTLTNINIQEDIIIPEEIEKDVNKINNSEIISPFSDVISEPSDEIFEELETSDDDKIAFAESYDSNIKPNNIYYDIINNISKEMSTLLIDEKAYKKFNDIISNNFNFNKSALLIYFPPKQKFILWNGKNLDEDSSTNLSFDLEFNNIYKSLSKEKSYFIKKENPLFHNFSSLFSEYDYNDNDFLLWIPFIFSARIIGVFLGLKLYENNIPSDELINSLEIIGRLNGPLLYNLYQQETIKQQQKKISRDMDLGINPEEKKNYQKEVIQEISNDPVISNVLLDDYDKNQTDNIIVQLNDMEEIKTPELINTEMDIEPENEKSIQIEIKETNVKEVDLFDIFPENIHKLIFFAQQTLTNSPESPLTLIHIQFENNDEIQNLIPNFRFETFYSDIQFVIMNVVGTNGFVQILRDMNIYIVLPEIKKSLSHDLLNEIINQLNNMFKEIHDDVTVKFKNKIVNYPEDAKDYLDIFYKIQNF